MANRQGPGESADASILYLKALRMETVSAIKTLDAVEQHSTTVIARTSAPGPVRSTAKAPGEAFSAPPNAATAPFLNVEDAAATGRSLYRR